MKVVLFCGGFGTRLREHSETIPKALVTIGYRPIIWHIMKYYAHFGHKDFILCLGYMGDLIKKYFLNYQESLSNDFLFKKGGREIELYNTDIQDWNIEFIETGLHSNLGQRLLAVKKYLKDEDMFMANYSDGLSDLYLPDYINDFKQKNAIASLLSVQPSQSFHAVRMDKDGFITGIDDITNSDLWINGGFFILRQEIFEYINEGEELVLEPFERLYGLRKLVTRQYKGFWYAIDTFKDYKKIEAMNAANDTPWKVWEQGKGKK